MNVIDLRLEHAKIDRLIGKHEPNMDELKGLGYETLSAAKHRRCQLKTMILVHIKRGDQDATDYATKRKWGIPIAT